jgi:hypothetical protein
MSSTEEKRSPIWTVAEDTNDESLRWRMFARLAIDGGGLRALLPGEYVVDGRSKKDAFEATVFLGNKE